MFGALKTVEDHNLFASFGLVDGLNEKELETVNGGLFLPTNIIDISCTLNTGTNGDNNNSGHGSGSGNNNGNGNGSGNSGGSSDSGSSSSSSSS